MFQNYEPKRTNTAWPQYCMDTAMLIWTQHVNALQILKHALGNVYRHSCLTHTEIQASSVLRRGEI